MAFEEEAFHKVTSIVIYSYCFYSFALSLVKNATRNLSHGLETMIYQLRKEMDQFRRQPINQSVNQSIIQSIIQSVLRPTSQAFLDVTRYCYALSKCSRDQY